MLIVTCPFVYITSCMLLICILFISSGSVVQESACDAGDTQETQVQSPSQEDPLEKEMTPTAVFLPGKSHRQRSLVGYSPWSCKELDMTEQLSHTHTHTLSHTHTHTHTLSLTHTHTIGKKGHFAASQSK